MRRSVAILLVANFGTNTGYAWNMIEDYFAGIAEIMSQRGVGALICYKDTSNGYPLRFRNMPVEILPFDYSNEHFGNILKFLRLLFTKRIAILYLSDQPTYAFRYILFRLAGVRKIIVHDHTSEVRTIPGGTKRMIKQIIHRLPYLSADCCIGVSEFVKKRLLSVNCVPSSKVRCICNGVDIGKYSPGDDDLLLRELGIDRDKKIVFFSGRANYYKGVHVLIEAAEELLRKRNRTNIVFVCCGDGPNLEDFKRMVISKGIQDSFFFLGKRDDIHRLLKSATVAVAPSTWEEAFGLTVIEAMASGLPIIASRVGGIPEIIKHGVNGYLIEPGRADILADMIDALLKDAEVRREIGKRAREHIEGYFNIKRSIKELQELFLAFGN